MPAEPADGEASDQELPIVFYAAAAAAAAAAVATELPGAMAALEIWWDVALGSY